MSIYGLFLFLLMSLEFVCGYNVPEYNKRKTICTLPPAYGNCRHQTNMWYFDYSDKKCKRFVYSICGGNRNRFFTFKECTNFCDIPSVYW